MWLMLLLALPAAPAGAVKIERMSPPPLDLEVPVPGTYPVISADGRFVAFVVEDRNIYVRDRQSGKTELVSVGLTGEPANGDSFGPPSISGDGRFVAFTSSADNLVPGDTNGKTDLFVRDRQTGKTELVSAAVQGFFLYFPTPAISGDGRFVAFRSEADNLVPGDTNEAADLFVRDRVTSTTEIITVTVNVGRTPLDSGQPAISGDGQWVVFVTAGQVFERNRITGAAALVSVSTSGRPANGNSSSPSISADGRFVAFVSQATNLVPGDTNSGIFVRDRQTGQTELVSVTPSGAPANRYSFSPSISADGRFVAFGSGATNLVGHHCGHEEPPLGETSPREEVPMPQKRYVVDLTSEERITLEALIQKGKAAARSVRRAHTLLMAADGFSDLAIARALHIGHATVERTRQRFVFEGLQAALKEKPRPGGERKLDGKQEAFLVALACSAPPEGRAHWSMQLLADRLVTLGVVDALSDETVRRRLKETNCSRGGTSAGASPR